jgi:hypothetical protein
LVEGKKILDAGCIQEKCKGSFETWSILTDSVGLPAEAVPRTAARAKSENFIVVDGWMEKRKS